jgi:tetratricopeptide (TPR) repeat protein
MKARLVSGLVLGLALLVTTGHAQTARAAAPSTVAPPRPATTALPALTPDEMQRLQRAVGMREGGLPERARDTLLTMLRTRPHDPRLVRELGRCEVQRGDWNAVERLATAERLLARDTLLLAPELALAQERLGRPRDAIRTALEAWTTSPAEGPWAAATVLRLAPVDARTTQQLFEAAVLPRPWRTDLVMGLARLHAISGRADEATRVLADAEHRGNRGNLRVMFADECLRTSARADSNAAFAALFDLTRDAARRPEERLATGRRLWIAAQATGREAEWAPRLAQALRDVPGERWGPDLVLSLVRALQRNGAAAEARALIAANPALERRLPDLALERAASLAREGRLDEARPLVDSLAGVWAPARFLRAEFEFFAGELDSAIVHYTQVSERSDDPDAATALDRLYLLEESPRAKVRPMLGQIAYERWRGRTAVARVLADSLWRMQAPRGEYAAHAALESATLRLEAGDARGALAPLLVVCDSLPDDRLAPVARQKAGDAYAALGDTRNALLQYEECLARYPRAWNSSEVRRRVERLRREKRL